MPFRKLISIMLLLCMICFAACGGGNAPSAAFPEQEADTRLPSGLPGFAGRPQAPAQGQSAEPTAPESFVGLYQAAPLDDPAGYPGRLALNADGSFYQASRQRLAGNRVRYRYGTWSLTEDSLYMILEVTEQIILADAAEGPFFAGWDVGVRNAGTICVNLPETIRNALEANVTTDPASGKRTFTINGGRYWEQPDAETDSLQKEYDAAKARAQLVVISGQSGGPRAGCWETTDRGGEDDGIPRVDEVIGGVPVSVRADWRALEIGADGSFALWERAVEEGTWAVRRVFGYAAAQDGYLFLSTHIVGLYKGGNLEGITHRGDEPYLYRPVAVLKIIEWDEETLEIEGWETLYNFAGKADRPPWSAAMAEDSLSASAPADIG